MSGDIGKILDRVFRDTVGKKNLGAINAAVFNGEGVIKYISAGYADKRE